MTASHYENIVLGLMHEAMETGLKCALWSVIWPVVVSDAYLRAMHLRSGDRSSYFSGTRNLDREIDLLIASEKLLIN